MTTTGNKPLIAVVGATGQQGGAVVRALQAGAQFGVRALSRTVELRIETFNLLNTFNWALRLPA